MNAVRLLGFHIIAVFFLAGCGGRTALGNLPGDERAARADADGSAGRDAPADALVVVDGESARDARGEVPRDSACLGTPPATPIAREARWLVLNETGREAQNAVAFRVSASGIGGRRSLGTNDAIRGAGFSPDGRWFVRRVWGGPVYLDDMSGSEPGPFTVLRDVGYEVNWSPAVSLLLLAHKPEQKGIGVMDIRCGSQEVQNLSLVGHVQLVNPSPMWAPGGERVVLRTNVGTMEVVDFRSRPATVTSIATGNIGFSCWDCAWSPDGRWVVGISHPRSSAWQVAGIDTSTPDRSIRPLTEIQDVPILSVTWANATWLLFTTENGQWLGPTYASRVDVLPAASMVEFPSSARLSPSGDWVAFVRERGGSSTVGVCLVELGPDGASRPMQIAPETPDNIYWTPDGKHLWYLLHTDQPLRFEGWIIPNITRGGRPVRFTGDAGDVGASPDSDWLLWRSSENGVERLYAYHVASASTQSLVPGPTGYRRWSDDGAFLAVLKADATQLILFHERGDKLVELGRIDAVTGTLDAGMHWQPVTQ